MASDPRLPTQVKQPWEERLYNFDFRHPTVAKDHQLVPSGRSISSVESVEPQASTQSGDTSLAVEGAPTNDGDAVVQVRLKGGADGEDYPIRVRIIDNLNQKIEGDGILKVRQLGK